MLSFLKYLLSALILLAVILSVAWLILDRAAGLRLYSVQSGSMAPALHKGDLVLDARAKIAQLKPGDVASYLSPSIPGTVITHRVVHVDYAAGTVLMRGDNAPRPDAPVAGRYLIGRTLKVIPNLGYLFDAVRQPVGLVTIVYVPAFLISAAEIWLVAGTYRYRPYQLI